MIHELHVSQLRLDAQPSAVTRSQAPMCSAPGCRSGPCRMAAPWLIASRLEVPAGCPNRCALPESTLALARLVAVQEFYLTPAARAAMQRLPRAADRENVCALLLAGELVLLERRVRHEVYSVTALVQPTEAPPPIVVPPPIRSWIAFQVVEDETGEEIPNVRLTIRLPNGTTTEESTRADGRIELREIDPGTCDASCVRDGARIVQTLGFAALGPQPSAADDQQKIEIGQPFRERAELRVLNVEKHRVRTGESIAQLAEQNNMRWQDLAEFNWDTSVPREINRHLEVEVGCTQRARDGHNYMFDDSDRPGFVYVPSDWSARGLATETEHVIRVRKPVRLKWIESTFAWEQFCGVARYFPKKDFWLWAVTIFGSDVPFDAIERLRQALLRREVPNPRIDLLDAAELQGHEAAYNKRRRRIEIDRELPEQALRDRDASWRLMISLVEEFGHHIDHLLRNEYSNIGGDAPFDEGAAYAHALALLKLDQRTQTPYATYFDARREHELVVEHGEFFEAAQRHANIREIFNDEQEGEREYFGAGGGHGEGFGHESIEQQAQAQMSVSQPITETERKRIYFGNWERDYSQAICPALVRSPRAEWYTGFTRRALTSVLRILAKLRFGMAPEFNVTMANLGVYRSEEHIDNPFKLEDASRDDPGFNGACTDENAAPLQPDDWARKRFIRHGGGGWPTAAQYLSQELWAAWSGGRGSARALRRLGNGLHTLEDFFAHSNYIELALRRIGRETGDAAMQRVDPWVPIGTGPRGRSVLTTGCFGGLDAAASILLEIGEKLQDAEPFRPGPPSSSERIALILITDLDENWGRYYATFLDFKEQVATTPVLRTAAWAMYHTVGALLRAAKLVIGAAVRVIGNQIDEAELLFGENSTNPTHTQIAKDHHDHHFHELAAKLAMEAVRDVTTKMVQAWAGQATVNDVTQTAVSYLVHPEDDPRLAPGGSMRGVIASWSPGHRDAIVRGAARSWPEHEWARMRQRVEPWLRNLDFQRLRQLIDDVI